MEDEENNRKLGKRFKCHNCLAKFTKLVKPSDDRANCNKKILKKVKIATIFLSK